MNDADVTGFLASASDMAVRAGQILIDLRKNARVKTVKDSLSMDIATTADYASEKYIVDAIRKQYPEHSILTEETLGLDRVSDYEWIIDPLDGTKEYIRNIPYYYVLIALEYQGKLICSAANQPETNRLFTADLSKGVKINGSPVGLSPVADLEHSFINVRLPNHTWKEEELSRLYDFIQEITHLAYRIRSNEWDVEALFSIASGSAEGYILAQSPGIRGPKWWDVAPGILAVLASGGMVTDFYNKPIVDRNITKGIVATNGKIHDKLICLLNKYYK